MVDPKRKIEYNNSMLSKKELKMTEFETNCYGMSEADIREQYMNSITAKCSGLEMVVAGIMSDCQEMIAMKNPSIPAPLTDELIRCNLNIAKFILFEIMDAKRNQSETAYYGA
jgi:hypothetical protein